MHTTAAAAPATNAREWTDRLDRCLGLCDIETICQMTEELPALVEHVKREGQERDVLEALSTALGRAELLLCERMAGISERLKAISGGSGVVSGYRTPTAQSKSLDDSR